MHTEPRPTGCAYLIMFALNQVLIISLKRLRTRTPLNGSNQQYFSSEGMQGTAMFMALKAGLLMKFCDIAYNSPSITAEGTQSATPKMSTQVM